MLDGFTELNDRVLFYDGTVGVQDLHSAKELILQGLQPEQLFDLGLPEEEVQALERLQAPLKRDVPVIPAPELLPEVQCSDEELLQHLQEKLEEHLKEVQDPEPYLSRFENELAFFHATGSLKVLKLLKYVLHELQAKRVLYGVGRGSSCACYLMFLMGLHCIDPVLHQVSFTEFSKR